MVVMLCVLRVLDYLLEGVRMSGVMFVRVLLRRATGFDWRAGSGVVLFDACWFVLIGVSVEVWLYVLDVVCVLMGVVVRDVGIEEYCKMFL